MSADRQQIQQRELLPFLWVSLGWLAVSIAIRKTPSAMLIGVWALCMFDLFALSSATRGVLAIASGGAENRGAAVINTFTWGALKLACLGVFGLIAFRAQGAATADFLFGMGTMFIVPFLGGLWWSQGNSYA